MTREIKFRAWDKTEKQMISAEDWYFLYEFEPFVRSVERARENFEIMQYTGLKDRNGKEIYEGDILKENNQVGMVEFCEDGYQVIGLLGYWYGGEGKEFSWEQLEVIGNIYEHPHLLENKS